MEDLLKYVVGVLLTIIGAGGAVVVSYFKSIQRKYDKLEADNKDKDAKIKDKEENIQHLHNGFREEVKQEILEIKQDLKLIKKYLGGIK